MIPCHYCGGTPELLHHKADMGHFAADSYMVVCKNCGARTLDDTDPELVKLMWDKERVMKVVSEEKEMKRYIEIDGKKIEVKCCAACPCFSEIGKDGRGPWCKHPDAGRYILTYLPDRRYGQYCPLREVPQ